MLWDTLQMILILFHTPPTKIRIVGHKIYYRSFDKYVDLAVLLVGIRSL